MNLVFLGPPGSGKGTQAVRLAQEKGLVHLSTGDVLRAAVKAGTTLGMKAGGYMSRGELVPDDLIISLIEEKVASGELSRGFILDGFPRTVPQAKSLDSMFAKNRIKLDKAILLDVGDAEILKRLKGRAEKEGRADDTEEVILNRLEVYRRQTQPIEELYRQQSILVQIKGEDTPDRIFAAIVKAVE
ncbi:MAG: adenylate kinase [Candidatus Zixiibacteriota bacterium]